MDIWNQSRRVKFINKIISIFIIQAFLVSNISFATTAKTNIEQPKKQDIVTAPDGIIVPRDFGMVKNKYNGNSGKLVIHIQDAHCNYEAQSNIVKILETLIKNYSLGLVSVEGADGFIDTSWFKAFPDDEVRKEVADYFMKKGEITGPEFLSITTNLPFKLFGAETRSYYIDNLNAFTSSYSLKPETEKYFNSIKSVLNRLKGLIYSEELKTLDAKIQDYDSKKLQFNDYVRYLQGVAEHHQINLRSYENLFRLISVLIYEKKIDFNVTDKERSSLIDELSKTMPKDALQKLVEHSIAFKSGKVSSSEYYAYLKGLAAVNNIDLAKKYPNLYNYIIYNAVYSKIENEKLFQDLKDVELAIKEKLFSNDDQRMLEKLSRHIDIMLGLVNIKLMNGDFDYYQANKSQFTSEYFEDFIKKKTVQYGLAYDVTPASDAITKSIPQLENFYSIAIKRDKALVDNTLSAMKKERQNIAVLVTGGFHSEGIARLLEKQGISYMVVCPSITKDVPTPYIEILTNQRTPLENILVGTAHAKEASVGIPSRAQLIGMSKTEFASYIKRLEDGEKLALKISDIKDRWVEITVKGENSVDTRLGVIDIKGFIERTRGATRTDVATIINELRHELHKRCEKLGLSKLTTEILLNDLENELVSFNSRMDEFEKEYERRAAQFARERPGTPGTGAVRNSELDIPFTDMIGFNTPYTTIEADKIGMAIKSTILARKSREVHEHHTGGSFVVLDDATYAKFAAGFGAPQDILCHPGTKGTRSIYEQDPRPEVYDNKVKRYYYIKESLFNRLNSEERLVFAMHEEMHIKIALGIIKVPTGENEERFVNSQKGCDVRRIMARFGSIPHMADVLMTETLYGDVAKNHIERLLSEGKTAELAEFVRTVYPRRVNIVKMKRVLTEMPYKGYDVIMISSTTEGEAAEQAKNIEKAFELVRTENAALGNKVCVLSIFDPSEGGQIIGQNNTWDKAIKDAFKKWAKENNIPSQNRDLERLYSQGKVKIATYHNGGKAERFSPAGQSFNLSRADQPLVGELIDSRGVDVQLNLLLAVILSTSFNADSNDGSCHDVYWANQIEFGTELNTKRGDYIFSKFAVGLPVNPNMKDLFDYGTIITSKEGKVLKFLANKRLTKKNKKTGRYEPNPDYKNQLDELLTAAKEGRAYFDYGSFSMTKEMQDALFVYWRDVKKIFDVMESQGGKAGISRDIDPAFIQILVPIINGLIGNEEALKNLPTAEDLDSPDKNRTLLLEKAFAALLEKMNPEYRAALEIIYKNALKKLDEHQIWAIYETVEFFIRHKDTLFKDMDKVIGIIDFGPDSHWFAYKRLLDMANEKFFMLADLTGNNMELEPNGNISTTPAEVMDKVKAEDARRIRRIRYDAVCRFEVAGRTVSLTAQQVREGWEGYGVKIKGSVIQGKTILLPGSIIIDSVVNNSHGIIVARNSYVESSAAPIIEATNSIIVKGIDRESIRADKEIVADAFRPEIQDSRFSRGQTRMRAPVGYDPKPDDKELAAKMSDKVKFGNNKYSFSEIREMPCDKTANEALEEAARSSVVKLLEGLIVENLPPTMNKRYQVSKKEFSRSTFGDQLVFGTSGIRELVKYLEDIKCYSIAKAIASYFRGMNEPDTVALAADLRPSSPRITQDMIMGNLAMGKKVIYTGNIPTPAVVNYGMYKKSGAVPSAMVTASHCPVLPEAKHQNGIKPNRTTGEVLKQDERLILKTVREFLELEFMMQESESMFDAEGKLKAAGLTQAQSDIVKRALELYNGVDAEAETMYVGRYVDTFGQIFDGSDNIDFLRHMSVGRNIITEIFMQMGAGIRAQIDQTQWQEGFVVDTEDLQPKLVSAVKGIADSNAAAHKPVKGIFTTDGDSDRPALFDEFGNFIYGDKLGYLTCEYIRNLKAHQDGKTKFFAAVTATVSNAVIERLKSIGFEVEVVKIGSPYVVKAMEDRMEKAKKSGEKVICMGFERNGGFLLGSDIMLDSGKILKALPTRDAVLPIIAAFALAKNRPIEGDPTKKNGTIGQLVADRFSGDYASYGWSGLIEAKAGMGEYCDLYTANMGQAIMRSFSPRDLNIVEVTFNDDRSVSYLTRSGEVRQAGPGDEFALYMNAIKAKLEGHFKAVDAFTGGIIKIGYLDGVRMFFRNKLSIYGQMKDVTEIVHMRPSGNAPQWRIYSEAATQERAEQITGYRLPVYPNIIKEYLENKKQFEGVHIAPRSNDEIKNTFEGIFNHGADRWNTWTMEFGPNSEHSGTEGIIFGADNKSVSFFKTTVYNIGVDKALAWLPRPGYKGLVLKVERVITWDRVKGALTCAEKWSDGREVSVTYKGPDAWLEIGRGLDKNIPMGKFQDMPFPVISDKARDFFRQNGIAWLDLFDVSVESEFTAEAPMWAHNFNFEQAQPGAAMKTSDRTAVAASEKPVVTRSPGIRAVRASFLDSRFIPADEAVQLVLNKYFTGEGIVNAMFEGKLESDYLPILSVVVNGLNKEYAAMTSEEMDAAWPRLERFYAAVTDRALSVKDVEIAKGLQIMVGNTIALQNLIENGIAGAEDITLTANPDEMLKAADVNRGPSYINGLSIPANMTVATKEGAQGIYWRGAEGVSKLGANILDDMKYVEDNKPELERLVMYTMLHVNGLHTTVFLHKTLPGSVQHISTGKGHFQREKLDVKRVARGEVVQFNDLYNLRGTLNRTTAQVVRPGERTSALPHSIDYMSPLSRIAVFNDFSVEANPEQVKKLNPLMERDASAIAAYIPIENNTVNYTVIELDGKPALVANPQALSLSQIGYKHTDSALIGLLSTILDASYRPIKDETMSDLVTSVVDGADEPKQILALENLGSDKLKSYTLALRALYENRIDAGKPVKVLPLLKTYPWGLPIGAEDVTNFILRNLGAKDSAGEQHVAGEIAMITGTKISSSDRIGESWLGKGSVATGTHNLPVETLSVFAHDIYGERNVEGRGPISGITAKILQAGTDLSWQIHLGFAEKVTALEKTTVFVALSGKMTKEEFLKAVKEGRTDIFNEVTLNPGETLIVPAKCPHAYKAGSVVVEFKDIDTDSPAETYSFYDRGRLTTSEKQIISEAVRAAGYDSAAAKSAIQNANPDLYNKLFNDKSPLIRKGKDGLTISQDTLEKIASEIENAGYLNKVEPSQLMLKEPILLSEKLTKNDARAEIIGITEGSVGLRYTVKKGQSVRGDTFSLGSGQPLTVLKGAVRIRTENNKEEVAEEGTQIIIPYSAKGYSIESLEEESIVVTSYMPLEHETLVNMGFEAIRVNLDKVRSNRVCLVTTEKAFVRGDEHTIGSWKYERKILGAISNGMVDVKAIEATTVERLKDSLKGLVGAESGVTYVVQLTEDELDSIKNDAEIAKLLKNTRLMPPLPNVKFAENKGIPFIREIESAGVILGNTTEKDISDKTIIAGWLKTVMSKLSGNKSIEWDMLSTLLKTPDPATFAQRIKVLLENLAVKIQPYEADKELHGRRELLWSV